MAFLGGENAAWRMVPLRTHLGRAGAGRSWTIAAALVLVACSNPCDTLAERVCNDLSDADCQLFIADSRLSKGMLPLDDPAERRLSVAGPTCEKWLAQDTYRSRTLPLVRERIARARAAGEREPQPLPGTTRIEPIASAPPLSRYALFPAALVLVAVAAWFGHRKLRKVVGAPRPRLYTPPP